MNKRNDVTMNVVLCLLGGPLCICLRKAYGFSGSLRRGDGVSRTG